MRKFVRYIKEGKTFSVNDSLGEWLTYLVFYHLWNCFTWEEKKYFSY